MTEHQASTGRPPRARGALVLAAAGTVGALVLLAVWLLGGRGKDDRAPGPGGRAGLSAGGDETSTAPAITAERQVLAASEVVQPLAGSAEHDAATPAESAVALWTGPTSTFTGLVVDHEDRPLAGATVTCWPSHDTRQALGIEQDFVWPELDPALHTITSDEGRFVLQVPHLAPGPGRVHFDERRDFPALLFEAEGFAVRSVVCLGVLSGDYDAGTIVVEPGGYLVGRLVDERGRPLVAARVQARQDRADPLHVVEDTQAYRGIEPAISDLSGEDGGFELGGFWPGTASIWFIAAGFVTSSRGPEPIEVGSRRDLGDIVVSKGASISGIVTSADSAPIHGASVLVDKAEALPDNGETHDTVLMDIERLRVRGQPTVETSAEGRFTLTGLEVANYCLYVDAAGFEPLAVRDVAPGAEPVRLSLVRQATLRLSVVDAATREPVSGANVDAIRQSGHGSFSHLPVRVAPEPGAFVVDRIGTRRTDLIVAANGYATGGFSIDGAKPPETIEHTVELEPEARITGRVLAADGTPIAAAEVATLPSNDAPVRLPSQAATSAADGRYELVGLAPGEWRLRADARGFVRGKRSVTIPASGTLADVELVLEAGATIFGTRFDGAGLPWPGKRVTLRRVADNLSAGTVAAATDVNGNYRAEGLSAGTWKVGDKPEVVVEVAAGQSLRVDLSEQRPASIRGQVLANGQPKTGVVVMALDRATEKKMGFASLSAVVEAGADGRYELEVAAGDYYVQAGGVDPPCGGSIAVPLVLAEGEQRVVDLVFGGERLSILVAEAASDRPLRGASVTLVRASEADPLTPDLSFGRTEFWPYTDGDGRAELPFVLPGAYSLRCRLEGFLDANVPVTVTAGGSPQEVRIVLEGMAWLRGTVKLSTGVPSPDGMPVMLLREGEAEAQATSTRTENGSFAFEGVRGGDYRLAVWDRWPGADRSPALLPLVELPVTLKAGESKSVELIVPVSP